ncbi:MAG: beta strand repeat-containing protein [Pirellulales bacterium]
MFSWTPSGSQGPGNYTITVRVTDNGSPAQSDSETITVSVVASVVQEVRYFSTSTPATLRNSDGTIVNASATDIVGLEILNGGQYRYRILFDGGDVGFAGAGGNVDAFTMLSDGSILLSTNGAFSVYSNYSGGVGSGQVLTGTGSDLLRFIPTELGDDTSGIWSIHFRGANVGLTTASENIDGVAALADGRLFISTSGSISVPGAAGSGEDVFLFVPTALGNATQGTWMLFVDGSDVGLSTSENIDAIGVREQAGALPMLYLSTAGAFSVPGVVGSAEDVFSFQPTGIGTTTKGNFGVAWDGSQHGLAGLSVDGINFVTLPSGGGNNAQPTIANISNRSVNEGTLLSFVVNANANDAGQTLKFSLAPGAPAGAMIGASSGVFSWTAQGPGIYNITVLVSDDGSPVLFAAQTFTITVLDINVSPVLAPIGNKSVVEGNSLTFTATASDADVPANTLTYSLDAGAPAGATINPATGVFSWTPSVNQAPGTYTVTIRVTDNGSPALSDFETINIEVEELVVQDTRYFSTNYDWPLRNSNGTSLGVSSSDIAKYEKFNGGQFQYRMHFDGSDVGLGGGYENIDAFTFLADGSILVSTAGAFSVSTTYATPGIGSGAILNGTAQDILRFTPSSLGDNTAGTWSLYFKGANVGLTKSGENIDGLSVLADGRLLISTTGSYSVPGASGDGYDVLLFTPTSWGANTAGILWQMFDGSDVGLTKSNENVNAIHVREQAGAQPMIYISTLGEFSVSGAAGTGTDIVAFRFGSMGSATAGAFGPGLDWVGGANGFAGISIDGMYLSTYPGTLGSSDSDDDINVSPVLAPIGNKSVVEGNSLTFTATASDADVPANTLTYSLDAGAPAGATINPATGVFSWTPSVNQAPGTYTVTIRVTDNGSPALSDFETINIEVEELVVQDTRYFSTNYDWPLRNSNGTSLGVSSSDIAKYEKFNGGQFQYRMHFDGSDVGLGGGYENIDAFTFLADGSILVSTAGAFSVSTTYATPGIGSGAILNGTAQDILRFTPSSLGDNTAGTWSLYFKGANVGLTKSGENIDGLSVLADGRLLISTTGSYSVPGASGDGYDVLLFTPTSWGANTAGILWQMFDGSDVGLTKSNENVNAIHVREQAGAQPMIYISTLGEFSVSGAAGTGTDIVAFRFGSMGSATAGAFGPGLDWVGGANGFAGISIDGMYLSTYPGTLGSSGMGANLLDDSSPSVSPNANSRTATTPTAIGVLSTSGAIDQGASAGHESTIQANPASATVTADQLLNFLFVSPNSNGNLAKNGEPETTIDKSESEAQLLMRVGLQEFGRFTSLSVANVDRVFGAW